MRWTGKEKRGTNGDRTSLGGDTNLESIIKQLEHNLNIVCHMKRETTFVDICLWRDIHIIHYFGTFGLGSSFVLVSKLDGLEP